eukprot:scaffold24676_cov31-Prasinocladus_malaysianus.AAC.1
MSSGSSKMDSRGRFHFPPAVMVGADVILSLVARGSVGRADAREAMDRMAASLQRCVDAIKAYMDETAKPAASMTANEAYSEPDIHPASVGYQAELADSEGKPPAATAKIETRSELNPVQGVHDIESQNPPMHASHLGPLVPQVDDDGNENICGSCQLPGILLCCEGCIAAFHPQCAGYADEEDVPDGEWLCWSCSRSAGKIFHPVKPMDVAPEELLVASQKTFELYRKATKINESVESIQFRYRNVPRGVETLPRDSPRLWRGTSSQVGRRSIPTRNELRSVGTGAARNLGPKGEPRLLV